jgi:leucyl aminopeptidase (aminopeptidase T)
VSDLQRAVETVVGQCLGIQPGEDVVIVVDRTTESLGAALREAAKRLGAEPVVTVMEPREVDGQEPPRAIAAALAAAHVFIAPTRRSLSHTRARTAASDAGARGATLPGVTEDMLARLMACDFPAMAERSRRVAELLTAADEARVTCPRGSDMTFDLTGRDAIADDGDLSGDGAFGNLPCGEGFIAPAGGEGTVVARSLAAIGLAEEEPARLTIDQGHLVAASGPTGERLQAMLQPHGDAGTNLAELGVGTNDRAGLTGNVLEDEKILGTVHVAFGASDAIGGTVAVPIHLDVVVTDVTLTVGGTPVLEAGRYLL